ncbi:dephospho-CoA kinase [Nonlabens sp. Hel1_33_55]|uniref:dephospho-CoA kinase n=1 Tax=Nonlabens sp. Hel1_33_55 TaxID=1336802 RepID=UPI000875C957|nr:dephospho-CoA kinase [Nonlabens sp. Hel1_33_55]SCY13335.1 dephospho-CoA kinase [Nonlabens sp. Hel1_33_55]
MRVIGLTGGIGSGKSTVARAFQKLGVPVYIADEASKRILSEHPNAISQVTSLLGESAYVLNEDQHKVPNRKWIASKVFTDKKLLVDLNGILHPLVREDLQKWLVENQAHDYIIYEAAILFESGGDELCDKVLVVWSKEEERIARVVERDQVTESEVRQRLQNQWNDDQRLSKADFIIINDDIQLIEQFVKNIQEIMLK